MKKRSVVAVSTIYLFFLLGLALHTSRNPIILGKYSPLYFTAIFLLILGFWPMVKVVAWIEGLINKALIVLLLAIFLLLPFEIFLRHKYKNFESRTYRYTIDYFHPFLQSQLSPSENIQVNSHGFRGEEIKVKKPKGTYRIAILGGSTVLNREVPFEKNAVRLLEKQLRKQYPDKKIEVINAGKDWYNSEHSIIQYLFHVKDFDPDMVIIWQGANDLYTSCTPSSTQYGSFKSDYSHSFGALHNMAVNYFRPKPLIKIELVSLDFFLKFIEDNLYSDIVFFIREKELNEFAKLYRSSKGDFTEVTDFPSAAIYRRNLQTFIHIVKQAKIPLILGNQPSLYKPDPSHAETRRLIFPELVCKKDEKYYSMSSLLKGFKMFNNITERVAKENEILFIDLDKAVPKDLKHFSDSVHYTEKGNEEIADALFSFIQGNYFIK